MITSNIDGLIKALTYHANLDDKVVRARLMHEAADALLALDAYEEEQAMSAYRGAELDYAIKALNEMYS
jgi:hypothetical protein